MLQCMHILKCKHKFLYLSLAWKLGDLHVMQRGRQITYVDLAILIDIDAIKQIS